MKRKLEAVAQVISLNGGDIRGKTRLQKSFYFLETLGLGFGFDFQYYHYGPYSEELAEAVDDTVALGLVSQEWEQGPYPSAIYRSSGDETAHLEKAEERIKVLRTLSTYSAITLELAATADYLKLSGSGENAWDETRVRKPSKASAENMAAAKRLLTELGRA